jgi:hypothetical protein
MLKLLFFIVLFLLISVSVFAHAGPHGNDECIVKVGDTELRLNGYQFKGSNPDRHYCRHFPHLERIIIKVDSLSADLTKKSIELQLLKRQSWLGLVLNSDDAFKQIKQSPAQHFSQQVVSIDREITERDVYAVNLRLISADGSIAEQRFIFVVGIPFAQIMVVIAGLLFILIILIALKPLWSKRQ